MLTRYLFTLFFLTGSTASGTPVYPKVNPQIPQPILASLDSIFPAGKQVQWTKSHRKYRADFIYNGLTISITFEQNGEVSEGTEEISYTSLPSAISDKIQKNYESFKILLITRHYKKNNFQYEVEIIKGRLHYILNYTERGFLIHQYDIIKTDLSQFPTD